MPQPHTLPAQALAHLPEQAMEHRTRLSEANKVPDSEANIIRDFDPNHPLENMFGTPGEADIFVFSADTAPGSLPPGALIYGFEVGIDSIAIVNADRPYTRKPSTELIDGGFNDPNADDTQVNFSDANSVASVVIVDQSVSPKDLSFNVYDNDPFLTV